MTTLTAMFDTRAHAEHAAAQLRALGVPAAAIRTTQQPAPGPDGSTWLLNADVAPDRADEAQQTLHAAHAMHVERRHGPDDWPADRRMGLRDGRQTGAAVPPGKGDAETGTSAPSANAPGGAARRPRGAGDQA